MVAAPPLDYDFVVGRDDTLPFVKATLKGADGTIPDLAGCTIRFEMWSVNTGVVKINTATGVAIIGASVNGQVQYAWAVGDTNTPGYYYGHWNVTFPSGRVETFPNDPPYVIKVA